MKYAKVQRNALKREYEADPQQAIESLRQGIEAGDFRLGHNGTSLHDVFEAFTDRRVEDLFNTNKSRFESADFVGLNDFQVAAGLFLLGEANLGYKRPDFIADQLVTVREAGSLKMSQKIPYYPLPADDNAYDKQEGKPYNRVGAPYGYIESIPPKDQGFIIEVTREVLRDDKTGGGIAQNCYRQGEGLGIAREKDILKSVLGVQGTFKFGAQDAQPATSYNTYATSGAPYVNSQSNTMTSWKSFDTAIQLFAAMTDLVTGQVLGIPSNMVIVVPAALSMRTLNFLRSISVQEVDNQANSSTVRSEFTNPLTGNPFNVSFTVLTNQYVKVVTSSDTSWWIGAFTEGFNLANGWSMEQMEQGQESNAYFESNILYRQRFSYNQAAYAYAPFRVVKNT